MSYESEIERKRLASEHEIIGADELALAFEEVTEVGGLLGGGGIEGEEMERVEEDFDFTALLSGVLAALHARVKLREADGRDG